MLTSASTRISRLVSISGQQSTTALRTTLVGGKKFAFRIGWLMCVNITLVLVIVFVPGRTSVIKARAEHQEEKSYHQAFYVIAFKCWQ